MGTSETRRRLTGRPVARSRVSDQELNPDVVKELEARARKQL